MKNNKRNQGITLIALVVTIVVLLILAGVSIAMLTGENGVISQAKSAKEATEQAKVEELVSVAIGSVIAKNNGSTAGITPKMIADQINEDENRTDIYAENETTFPTYIIFPKEGRKAEANLNSGSSTSDPDAIYSEDVNEADIAPADLFDYEIINDGSTGALTLNSLPTKTVKITRIKPQYCNIDGYNPDTKTNDLSDTNYGVVKDNRTYNRLIIPYQVDGKYIPDGIEGEYYKVTEVSLVIPQIKRFTGEEKAYVSVPDIDELIYPNTVVKICSAGGDGYNKLKKIILSNKIEEIPEGFFCGSELLTSVTIPDSVKSLGFYSFANCKELVSVTLSNGLRSITPYAFAGCNKLKNISIPNSVEYIGDGALGECVNIDNISIPDGVKYIGEDVFAGCSNLENISISDSVEYIGSGAFSETKFINNIHDGDVYFGKVYYGYKGEMPSGTTIKIKEGTKSIADGAFYGCSGLETIEMSDSVEYIGYSTFQNCSSLKKVTISARIEKIGPYAFLGCTNLLKVTIPNNVSIMGWNVFGEWTSDQTINIQFKENEIPKGWHSDWKDGCNAVIKYLD